jgi:hypothetical protein
MKRTQVKVKIHIPPRGDGPMTGDELRTLTQFFELLMDFDVEHKVMKEDAHAKPHKRNTGNTN